jgi:hypothetical protein
MDLNGSVAGQVEAPRKPQRQFEHSIVNCLGESCHLRQRQKLANPEHAAHGMHPPDERLNCCDGALHVDDGLEERLYLTVG